MDSKVNKKDGTLIFTTHYSELLDEYDQNNGIHIIRNCNGITVEDLSNILERNDIKKSDAYQSELFEEITPVCEDATKLDIIDILVNNNFEIFFRSEMCFSFILICRLLKLL